MPRNFHAYIHDMSMWSTLWVDQANPSHIIIRNGMGSAYASSAAIPVGILPPMSSRQAKILEDFFARDESLKYFIPFLENPSAELTHLLRIRLAHVIRTVMAPIEYPCVVHFTNKSVKTVQIRYYRIASSGWIYGVVKVNSATSWIVQGDWTFGKLSELTDKIGKMIADIYIGDNASSAPQPNAS